MKPVEDEEKLMGWKKYFSRPIMAEAISGRLPFLGYDGFLE